LEAGLLAERLQNSVNEIDVSGKQLLATAFYNQACAYALKSEKTNAFAALDRALQFGFDDSALLKEDADLAGIRDDERFNKFASELESVAKEAIEAEVNKALSSTEPFPFDFNLENVTGEKVTLAELRGAKVTIVDIWGTWCPPCRMEIPHFVELHRQLKEDGLQIIGINYERGEKQDFVPKIEEYRNEAGIDYPLVIGDEATRNQVPDFQGYPTTLFLDSNGVVRAKLVGYHPKELLEGVVKRLMEKAK
jgi:thiol-disulfide isomerase/thioredoxin